MALLLVLAGAAAYQLTRPTTLTLAVAPEGGTEPGLLKAYAEALVRRKAGVRLNVIAFGGVRESAEALKSGEADLAVVRPDVMMPGNGLTLAVLREVAVFVAAPAASGLKAFSDLGGKRLGMLAARTADRALVAQLLAHYGLAMLTEPPAGAVSAQSVVLVPLEEAELGVAFAEKRIDAMVLASTPTSPAARRIVGRVQEASGEASGEAGVVLLGVADAPAVLAESPRLQAVTLPAGLYGGNPRLPEEELATVGSSYRLMARSTLSRSVAAEVTQHLFEMRTALAETVPAAEDVGPPAYEDTAEATSARLPNHPGAIDYYEREQETFIERYESWIYLIAIFGGGVGSTFAWIRRRIGRIRRERIEVATRRLLELRSAARRESDPTRLRAMAGEVDDLAAGIARHTLNRPAEPRMIAAATVAIDAARSTLRRALARGNAAPE